jgi:hypothetical protein
MFGVFLEGDPVSYRYIPEVLLDVVGAAVTGATETVGEDSTDEVHLGAACGGDIRCY